MQIPKRIPPGSTLGVLGTGQLGRMFCQAARRYGYNTVCWGPPGISPCTGVADCILQADWQDREAFSEFCAKCIAVTVELEQVCPDLLERIEQRLPLQPSWETVFVCQDRIREKNWLHRHGFPTNRYSVLTSTADLQSAAAAVGYPAVLKTASGGYDGHGQTKVHNLEELQAAWQKFQNRPCVLEEWLEDIREISVVTARDCFGESRCFPVCENIHKNHILAMTVMPARITKSVSEKARAFATQICQTMRLNGLLTVEFFLTRENVLLVNELAPRPHNSGHATIDACSHSQFDLQVLALTRHHLPVVEIKTNAVMVNLLGQLWNQGAPDFAPLSKNNNFKLHLYGKTVAKVGRKMGHLTVLGKFAEKYLETLQKLAEDQQPELLKSLS